MLWAILAIVMVVSIPGTTAAGCSDSVTIDSVKYSVGGWCGHKIDSSDIATPDDLVQLPQELTFDDYRIYVRPEVRKALVQMAAAARKDGVTLEADSGFRSRSFQRTLIRRRLESGESFDRIIRSVAPPGYSEHHTGRALDFCPSDPIFAKSAAYEWLKVNAGNFGFVESMPESTGAGVHWEPWHWLYTGN